VGRRPVVEYNMIFDTLCRLSTRIGLARGQAQEEVHVSYVHDHAHSKRYLNAVCRPVLNFMSTTAKAQVPRGL
jgi:hypothetical protein